MEQNSDEDFFLTTAPRIGSSNNSSKNNALFQLATKKESGEKVDTWHTKIKDQDL